MFQQPIAETQRNAVTDWVLRVGIAVAFLLFGKDKFPSGPDAEWVRLFAEVGIGQWFRYFTGIVEMLGAVMVLIPWTVTVGLTLLTCAMAGAMLIHIFVLHHPFNALIPGALMAGLIVFWRTRRDQ